MLEAFRVSRVLVEFDRESQLYQHPVDKVEVHDATPIKINDSRTSGSAMFWYLLA